jgi:hypothetical protein
MLQAPQDVLGLVGAPAEVRGIPAAEILVPVFEQRLVVRIRCAPAARDGVAEEIQIDLALGFLLQQGFVRQMRDFVEPAARLVRRFGDVAAS